MPELPDIATYLYALEPRVVGARLGQVRIVSPFVLRSADPPVAALAGRRVDAMRRLGKRIVFAFEEQYFAVLHLMLAGRLHWKPPAALIPRRVGLAAFDFPGGTLLVTEAGTQHRASLFVVRGAPALAAHDPGGQDVLTATLQQFREALGREAHTLKRALTDPRIFDGIGNAYSDEILHRARLSPLRLSTRLGPEESERLFRAAQATLAEWIGCLRAEAGTGFPEKVTAFRENMAVHGRFGEPCPVCGAPVQRIRYAENEVNYCARCQTGGRVLADRSLSRLLKEDWPRTLEEWEGRLGR
jgi:formamidopyrimidine-DNA glycosylase